MTAESILKLNGVHTHIGAYHILHGVDLQVPRGQLTMLLGRNGAGKSTTLRTIMGLWQGDIGTGAQRHRLRAGKHGYLRRIDRARKHGVGRTPCAQRRCHRYDAAGMDIQPVSRAEKILAIPGRKIVRRTKADAGGGACHHRAARTDPDR